MKLGTISAAGLFVLAVAPSARADMLSDGIEETLRRVEKSLDGPVLGPVHLRPSFSQSVIWTDNVFLNDEDEQPFRLLRVVRPGGSIVKSRDKLAAIQRNDPVFRGLASAGRVGDWLSRTDAGLDFVVPVNDEKTKLFRAKELKLLSLQGRVHEYADENDLDNSDFTVATDVFGFLSDLLSREGGNRIWGRFSGDYRRIEEPLDTNIVELQQIGIARVNFRNFQRTEAEVRADVGYGKPEQSRLDGFVGGEWFRMRLADGELRQAEYDRTNVHAQVGWGLPWFQQKHAYVRTDLDLYRPADRAVDGSQQALNDGDRFRAVLGLDGAFFSEKLAGRIEAGYMTWHPDRDSGLSGDLASFHRPVALVEVAYKPWEERKTQLQLSYERTADASAVANFNAIHRGTVSVIHNVIPDVLDTDLSFGFTRTDASEGPNSRLYDFGLGVVWHWIDHVDVSLRYLHRRNDSRNELYIDSSFVRAGTEYVYSSRSDGDFYQNVVELGLAVEF